MGRIKTTVIKRTGERLVEREEFSDNFEQNKKLLNEIMPSKRMRNMIAGYITRLVRRKSNTKQEA